MGREGAYQKFLGSSSLRTGKNTSPRPCGTLPLGQGGLLEVR